MTYVTISCDSTTILIENDWQKLPIINILYSISWTTPFHYFNMHALLSHLQFSHTQSDVLTSEESVICYIDTLRNATILTTVYDLHITLLILIC